MQTPTREDQMSEGDAVQSPHNDSNTTDILDHEKKSHHESPTHTSAIIEAENVEDERYYIIGWRLHLLTSRFSCTQADQDSTLGADALQSVSQSIIVNSGDHHRQYFTRQHRGCSPQIRPEWLGGHLLPLDLHWYTFLHYPP